MDALRATILHAMQHTSNVFLGEDGKAPRPFKPSESAKIACKIHDEYAKATAHVPAAKQARRSQGGGGSGGAATAAAAAGATAAGGGGGDGGGGAVADIIDDVAAASAERQGRGETAVVAYKRREEEKAALPAAQSKALALRKRSTMVDEPEWHAPWKLMRVISGHNGWVRAITVDPTNEWFATGGNDRMIKIWDLASGQLKLTLTGHISSVRGLACSARHPYLFSVSEDKMVKCWDLETNKVVRHYHGHLSGVYCVALHPTIDVLVTGGRDSVARVWDMRTRHPVHVLTGHKNTVMSVATQAAEPQIITGSMDCFVKLWDLKAGKCHATLTNHKKSIRALAIHPEEYTFMSGGGDNIKKWACPDGDFMKNFAGHNTIIHSMALNHDNVLMSGGDNGSLYFWDYKTGYNFQRLQTRVQPGSMDSEAAIFAATFDKSGSRLITCEADKTIKVWREDADATPDTHPVDMHAWTQLCRKRKRF